MRRHASAAELLQMRPKLLSEAAAPATHRSDLLSPSTKNYRKWVRAERARRVVCPAHLLQP
jgi:hypothetical protein